MLKQFIRVYDRAMKFLTILAGALSALILASLFVVMTMEIVSRYFFRMSYGWVMDYAQFGLIYVVFLAGSILFYHEEHISITIIPDRLSPKVLIVVKLLFNLVTLYFLHLLFRSGYIYAMLGATLYSTSRITLMIYPRMAVPIGTALMALQVLNNMFKGLEKLFTYSAADWRRLKEEAKTHEEKIFEKTVEELEEIKGETDDAAVPPSQ